MILDRTQISFMVGTVPDSQEVVVCFQGFTSSEEAEEYADWLSDNLGLPLDETSETVH